MGDPSEATFRTIAADLGIELSPDHLSAALAGHEIFRPKLEELRRVKLPYLDFIEPAHARQWVDNGGRGGNTRGRPN
jgi:hypothetical protein